MAVDCRFLSRRIRDFKKALIESKNVKTEKKSLLCVSIWIRANSFPEKLIAPRLETKLVRIIHALIKCRISSVTLLCLPPPTSTRDCIPG